MELTISNSLEDYLQHQLYVTSQSPKVKTKLKLMRLIVPIVYIFIAFFVVGTTTHLFLGLVMFVLALLWFIFYPKYASQRYRRHYTAHLKEHLSERFDRPMKVTLDSEKVLLENDGGNSTISKQEWDELVNLPNHFLQRIKGGSTIIYPKNQIENQTEFLNFFNQLNIPITDHTKWKW